MATSVYFTVSCPSCASEFPVDPERVPFQGVPAICSRCMRVFRVSVPPGVFRGMLALPLHHEPAESEVVEVVEVSEEIEVLEDVEVLEEVEVLEGFESLEEFETLDEPEEELEAVEEGGLDSEGLQDAGGLQDAVEVMEELEDAELLGDVEIIEELEFVEEVEEVEEVEVIEGLETTEVVDSWRQGREPPEAEREATVGAIEATGELEPKGELESEPDPEPPPPPPATLSSDTEGGGGVEGKSLSQGMARFGRRDPKDRARRLARVLVSDMITYHPARYEEALENDSLRELFADEVDKSWTEFVDQVGEEMAESTDYFLDALNEILARGRILYRGPGKPR